MNKLEVLKITKSYKEKKARDEFEYTFTDGVYGLLGPNGAGKSTFMNSITDNIIPDSGSVIFNGKNKNDDAEEYRCCLGYMPQQQQLYANMTLERFLYYMAALKGIKKADAAGQIDGLLQMVNLSDVRGKRMGTFSGGMKQRALIAQAVLGDPQIVVLDEPTAGLDPAERIRIRNLISGISLNRIVIVATHITSEIEMIAKEVLFLNKGRLEASGTVRDVCQNINGKVFEVRAGVEDWESLSDRYSVSNMIREGDDIILRIVSDKEPDMENKPVYPTIEDVYLYMYRVGDKTDPIVID